MKLLFIQVVKLLELNLLEYWQENDKKDSASAGMSVGITVEDEFFNKRGEVICHKEDQVTTANIFNANVFWLGKDNLVKGKKYKLKLATQEVEFEVFAINKVIDAATLKTNEDINYIKKNDVAEVTIKTKYPICFDEFGAIQSMGRFVIIDNYNTSGGGIISGTEDSLKREIKDLKSTNISIRKRLVGRKDREEALNQKGKVIWLTGLPGCGKNEIAVKLEKKLFDMGKKVYYIDSAIVRFGLSSDLSFTEADVHEQTRRIAEVANLFGDSGTITIVTAISRFKEDREYARSIIGKDNYVEVFVEAPSEVCKKRNANNYAEDRSGAIEYEKSDYPFVSIYVSDAEFNSGKKAEDIAMLLNY